MLARQRASGAEEHSSASPNASTSTGQQDVQLAVVVDIELAAAGRMEERDEAAATVSRRIVNRVTRLEADPAADRRRRLGGDEHAAAPLAHRAQPPAADAAERLRRGREEASPCAATRSHPPSIESSTGLTSCHDCHRRRRVERPGSGQVAELRRAEHNRRGIPAQAERTAAVATRSSPNHVRFKLSAPAKAAARRPREPIMHRFSSPVSSPARVVVGQMAARPTERDRPSAGFSRPA